jgi:hypothetical protein
LTGIFIIIGFIYFFSKIIFFSESVMIVGKKG